MGQQSHEFFLAAIGVRQIVLAVNKMDLVGFDRDIFDGIVRAFHDFAAKLGDTLMLPLPEGSAASRLLLIGLGNRAGFGRKQYRKALQSTAQALTKTGASDAAVYLAMEPVAELDMLYRARMVAEVFSSQAYKIPDLKTSPKPKARRLAAINVVTADARFGDVVAERTQVVSEVLPYRPGEFYLRELAPMRAVLHGLAGLSLLVVDGYADLDPGGRPGLGAHAHAEFGIPVIGVAKTAFHTATHAVPVLRGTSARPLFVTAAGMPRDEAAELVRHMAGQHRLPNAIRRADTLARTGPAAARLTDRQHG